MVTYQFCFGKEGTPFCRRTEVPGEGTCPSLLQGDVSVMLYCYRGYFISRLSFDPMRQWFSFHLQISDNASKLHIQVKKCFSRICGAVEAQGFLILVTVFTGIIQSVWEVRFGPKVCFNHQFTVIFHTGTEGPVPPL